MRLADEDAAMLRSLYLVELQSLDFQSMRVVDFASLKALVNCVFQVAIILDWFVKVWHRTLEHILDDALNDGVLFGGKLRVVIISDHLEDDVLLKLFLLVVLVWVDSDLSVDCSWLSLGELGVTPQPVVQLASAFIVFLFIIVSE